MSDLIPVKRALLSVSDKTDLVPFARRLVRHGVELISTGGTAKALEEAGIAVTPVDQVTDFRNSRWAGEDAPSEDSRRPAGAT